MKRFNKYFLLLLLKNFIISQTFIYFLYMFFMFFTQSKMIARYGASFKDILIYDIIKSPVFLEHTLPISFILSVVFTFIILIRTSEITAYVSIGGNLFSLIRMLFLSSLFISFAMFLLTDFIVPVSQMKSNEYKAKYIEKKEEVKVSSLNNIWFRDGNNFIQIGTVDIINQKIFDVKFIEISQNGEITKVKFIAQGDFLKNNLWEFKNYKEINTSDDPKVTANISKLQIENELFTKILNYSSISLPKELTIQQLKKIIKFYKSKGLDYSKHLRFYYNKFANIFNVIILLITIIPYIVDISRGFSYIKIATNGILVIFSFYILQSTFISLGKSGVLSPFLSNFLTYFIFIFVAIYGYYKKKNLFFYK
ncbi:MAG: LptF/LptG family permease [Calditerrivibrio sp.]|nr:LptF/LptG family permease [Calditerrivibrio sp.]